MNIRRVRQENQLLINLVFRLLPVQALIVAIDARVYHLFRPRFLKPCPSV